ncbi:MAG TPA: nucleotidyltransferase domain-containing protein [Thermoanaerobaculia bacterium]|nr:nucleotidyltransferase domain-containing protein [Thermoanaerobaculia bacterium]
MASIAIEIDKDKLRDFCRRWKITEFALFGSVIRPGVFHQDSDVDVLVTFAADSPRSLDAWIQMRDELKVLFGREVDLVERNGVDRMRNYLRRDAILETAVSLDIA